MGAFQDFSYNDGLEQAWTLARRYYPDLPEDYGTAFRKWEEEHGAGSLVRVQGDPGMVLTHKGNSYAVLMMTGQTVNVDAANVYFTGQKVGLPEIIQMYFRRIEDVKEIKSNLRQDGEQETASNGRQKAVYDSVTGLKYQSIQDWCKDTGLSVGSAHRLLKGEAEEVRGHRLEYAGNDAS